MPTLILCIDRDNDIGIKTGIETPIVGREACVKAAMQLGEADPEDTDVNTLFGGLQLYDALRGEGRDVEIMALAGDERVGLRSDERIARQLDNIAQTYPDAEVIVVSDGAEDEAVMPLVESRFKVKSVRRVIVRQSQNLESTYYLLRQVIGDRRTRNSIFTPIGLALLAYGISLAFGMVGYAIATMAVVVGAYILFKGLGMDEVLHVLRSGFKESLYGGKLSFIAYVGALVLFVVASVEGFIELWTYYSQPELFYGYLTLLLVFLRASVWWYAIGGLMLSLSMAADRYLEGVEIGRTSAYPFFVLATGILIWSGSSYLLELIQGGTTSVLSAGARMLMGSIVLSVGMTAAGLWVSNHIDERLRGRRDEDSV